MSLFSINIILLITFLFVFIYIMYQLYRNHKVYKIRIKWIEEHNLKRFKYSYDFMFDPSKHNWFGFKWPREKNYK